MVVRANEISKLIKDAIQQATDDVTITNVGTVISVGDGIANVYGLTRVMASELVEFPKSGVIGLAFNLEEESVGIIVLGDYKEIEEGDEVRATGRIASVPVGDALIGRVVDALGRPIDGKGPIPTDKTRTIERIIGDRQVGKSAIVMDTIINQKGQDLICIYVIIGQKQAQVAQSVRILEEYGAMEHTIVVVASAADPAPLQFIAPFAGCAIGEEFMETGRDAVCFYDDLSKHAAAYREVSLLVRRPPGREAYPGDVFYLHSRLLERSARLSNELGGGSLTSLPMIETQ